MRRFFSIAAWLIVGTALPLSAQEPKGKKYAVLVGVQEYSHADLPDLRFAQRDVLELSKLLTESGYDVTLLCHETGAKDAARKPTGANIDKHLKEILRKTERADSIIVAFAGHGMQFEKDDDAFFCPMDARPFADEKKTLVSLKNVYKEMERSFAGVKLLLVDACRNDPMLRRGRSGIDADNAPRPPRGVAAMFSCSAGEIAFEHEKLGHGVFFYYVLEGLRGKAKNARDQVTFNSLSDYVNTHVAEEVPKLIGGGAKQSPNLKADLSGAAPVLVSHVKELVAPPMKKETIPDEPKISRTTEGIRFSELVSLFGNTADSPKVKYFLEKIGGALEKEKVGGLYNHNLREHGLQLTFFDAFGGKLAQIALNDRLGLQKTYFGELPLGLTWSDKRADVLRKLGRPADSTARDDTFKEVAGVSAITVFYDMGRIQSISITGPFDVLLK